MAATLPLLVYSLKPCSNLSLLFSASRSSSFIGFLKPSLSRRSLGRNLVATAAFSTSPVQQHRSSADTINESSQEVSIPTFQQAIQRLQVSLHFVFSFCVPVLLLMLLTNEFSIFRNIGRQLDVL